MTATQFRLPSPQVLAPSLHHPNGSFEDESHMPRSLQALASAFNPVISHDSPPLAYSLTSQGNHHHPQQAYYNPRNGYQQATTQQQSPQSVHQAQQGAPNICLCPQVARVPRPRNAFILYRQHHHASVVAEHPGKTNPEISKIIGEQWRQLSSEEKAVWQKLGDEEKKSHLERFPDYRYQPRRNAKRQGNDVHTNSNVVSNGPPGQSSISICSKCHGQTPNSRGALFPKSPMLPEDYETHTHLYRQPSSPPARGSGLAPSMVTSPPPSNRQASHDHPTNPYLSGIKLPPASTAVAPASPPSLHHLPPIFTLPKDDVCFSSVSSATSSVSSASPPRPFACIRTRSQDDARQGVEALLSLTQASSGTPSPKTAVAKLATTLPACSSISSIVKSDGLAADGDRLNHKRISRSNSIEHDYARYSPPPSRRDSDSESHTLSQPPQYYVARASSSIVPRMKEATPQGDDGSRQTVRPYPSHFAMLTEKLREVSAIGVQLQRDRPRGAVIAVDGSPEAAKVVVSQLVQRIDQLAVCEANRAFEEAGVEDNDMPKECKILTKALAVHKELNGVFTFVNAQKSVLIDSYVLAFATDSCETLSYGKNARQSLVTGRKGDAMSLSSITNDCSSSPSSTIPASKSVPDDWYWCANLYRGTILPDLIIYIDFEAQETQELSLADGKTKALVVGGGEHVGIIEQEVRAIMGEVGKY
ncbi:hypothetical protein V1525DRAFT_203663 [Lipomyces kononenkoae]|uniref:Uncharacterized protein n=1 Tax=Lipomyces kononenkoae TaxID=34357 RepID=A0ACC3TC41_LIPKO